MLPTTSIAHVRERSFFETLLELLQLEFSICLILKDLHIRLSDLRKAIGLQYVLLAANLDRQGGRNIVVAHWRARRCGALAEGARTLHVLRLGGAEQSDRIVL